MLDLESSTLIFQVLNFFILLAGLSYFLYRPLLRVMREREEGIAAQLRAADEKTREATEERERLASREEQAKQEAVQTLERARSDATEQARKILDDAKRAAAEQEDRARQQLASGERAALERLRTQAADAAVAMASQLIGAVAGPEVHHALLDALLVGDLGVSPDDLATLQQVSRGAGQQILVEVAYPPAADLAQRFATALGSLAKSPVDPRSIRFQVTPELIAGARVLLGTLVIDLSLSRVLDQTRQHVVEARQ